MGNEKTKENDKINKDLIEKIKNISKNLSGKKPSFEPQSILEDLRAIRDSRS